jgi:hypothetical protein
MEDEVKRKKKEKTVWPSESILKPLNSTFC